MTADEYRVILADLSETQRAGLNGYIARQNEPSVEQMVSVFEKFPDTERMAVRWLNQELWGGTFMTDAQRINSATSYPKRGYSLILAIVVAVVSLIVIVAMVK
jgi:hypothetical protein